MPESPLQVSINKLLIQKCDLYIYMCFLIEESKKILTTDKHDWATPLCSISIMT